MSSISTSKNLLDITTQAFSQFAERIVVANVGGEEISYAQAQQKLQTVQQLLTSAGIEQEGIKRPVFLSFTMHNMHDVK